MSTVRRKKKSSVPETEEQKKARLELQAQREEEKRKKKEELAKKTILERQEKEEKYSRINGLQIQYQWRKLMRLAKEEELKRDIGVLNQAHEREVARKDDIIAQLEKDMEDVEEQFQLAIRSHFQNMDSLIELHRSRLNVVNKEFARDKKELNVEYNTERSILTRKHETEKEDALAVMNMMEEEYKRDEGETKQEFQGIRQDIKDKNSEEFSALRITLDTKIDSLERQFEQANRNYVDGTAQQTVKFKQLTEQDLHNAKTIEVNMRRLLRLQDSLNQWRAKMATNTRECEERNKALREEKEAVATHFQDLKTKMNKFREGQQRRLADLTQNVNNTLKDLARKQQKAEKILTLTEMNAKLESEQEQLMIFGESTVSDDDVTAGGEDRERAELHDFATTAVTKDGYSIEEQKYLDNFFKKYNKVALDKMALEQERARLEQENGDLRAILKQYLDGITVNENVINQANPLLLINQPINPSSPVAVVGSSSSAATTNRPQLQFVQQTVAR